LILLKTFNQFKKNPKELNLIANHLLASWNPYIY